jgi:hypothetical protein
MEANNETEIPAAEGICLQTMEFDSPDVREAIRRIVPLIKAAALRGEYFVIYELLIPNEAGEAACVRLRRAGYSAHYQSRAFLVSWR